MKQITEDYVSNEVGKLLEEKGFDWQQSPFYSEQDMDKWKQENSYQIPNPDYDPNIPFDTETITVVAPHISQSLALKWLREVHKILILIDWNLSEKEYIAYIWNIEKERQQGLHKLRKDGKYLFQYPSYETCIEESILYVLKNMI